MSGKKRETLKKILIICDDLSREGIRPSYEAIQKQLGGNNPTAIREALIIWYEQVFQGYHQYQQNLAEAKSQNDEYGEWQVQHAELMDTILKLNKEADQYQDRIVKLTTALSDYKQRLAGAQDYWLQRMVDQQNQQEVQHAKEISKLEAKIKNLESENRLLTMKVTQKTDL